MNLKMLDVIIFSSKCFAAVLVGTSKWSYSGVYEGVATQVMGSSKGLVAHCASKSSTNVF